MSPLSRLPLPPDNYLTHNISSLNSQAIKNLEDLHLQLARRERRKASPIAVMGGLASWEALAGQLVGLL